MYKVRGNTPANHGTTSTRSPAEWNQSVEATSSGFEEVGMNIEELRGNRYRRFNEKIDSFREHPKYGWLRKYADEAIGWNECFGYYQIKAEDFIERIERASLEYIRGWLDGENELEWSGIKEGQ